MKYTVNTWLLANFFHLAILYLMSLEEFSFALSPGEGGSFNFFEVFWLFFVSFLYSLFISVPSLVLAGCVMSILLKINLEPRRKYISLLFLTPMIVIVNIVFDSLVVGENLVEIFGIRFIIPSVIASILAILFRHRQFIKWADQNTEIRELTEVNK